MIWKCLVSENNFRQNPNPLTIRGVPIPLFNEQGMLPEGIHDCTLEEFRDRFGQFQSNDRRPRLFHGLQQFLLDLRRLGPIIVLVNGSFVTASLAPNDVDLIVVLPENWDFRAELTPDTYNLLSKKRVRNQRGFDILVASENTREYMEYIQFFQRVRYRRDVRKGLVRIRL
jgi:hypothetical protein